MKTRQVLLASVAVFAVVIATIGAAAAEPVQPPGSGPAASGGPGTQSGTAAVSSGKGPLSPRLQEIAAAGPKTVAGLRSAAGSAGLPESAPFTLSLGPGVSVEVTIRVATVSDETRRALTAAGAQITVASDETSSYSANVAPQDLNAVTAVPGVIAVSEVLQPGRPDPGVHAAAPKAKADVVGASACAPTTSLADTQLKAALARTNFGVDGTGIKIGVMSNSYAHKTSPTSAAQDVASGNLPGIGNPCGHTTPVQVLDDSYPGDDEGRAMLQLVHKVAPGATLMFATASVGGQIGFANNIRALQAAGANIIVDDEILGGEANFQDGIISNAISDVTAKGVTYLSAAGNENLVFNGNDVGSIELSSFRSMPCPTVVAVLPGVPANSCMNFAPSGPASSTAWFDVLPLSSSVLGVFLYYSEPLYGVTDDLDVFVLNDTETAVLGSATDNNIATGNPYEVVGVPADPAGPVHMKVVISRVLGSGTPRTQIAASGGPGHGNGADQEYSTSSGPMTVGPTITGHPGGTDTFSIAATPGPGAVPYPVGYPPVPPPPFPPMVSGVTPEAFSSRGPVTYDWGPFTTAATPATAIPATVLSKPDATSTDGDCTTFFGSPPNLPIPNCPFQFYGTSAATPNAGGVAALVLSRNKTQTPAQVKAIMAASAAPMSGGSLYSTGAGLLDANAALALVPTPAPVPAPVPAVNPLPAVLADLCPSGSCVGANLAGVNLAGADLAGVDFTGANFTGANLTGANLTGANLTGAILSAGTRSRSLAGRATLAANLTGANLTRANLTGVHAASVRFVHANLRHANLHHANLHHANLRHANLRHANLRGANLRHANLRGANLRHANLRGADLKGAKR